MSRNTRDIPLFDKPPSQVDALLRKWFSENRFDVSSDIADEYRIVATNAGMSGTIIFEISLKERKTGTDLHGEFYALGSGSSCKELDLTPDPFVTRDSIPRSRGYKLMNDLLTKLERSG